MLSSISPVGEAARRQRWWITALAFLVASTVAGLLLGVLAGLIGAIVIPAAKTAVGITSPPGSIMGSERTVELGLLALAAAIGLLLDFRGTVPTLQRQVDERWLTSYRGWVYGAGFGAQLGFGVVTIIPRSIVLLVVVAAFLSQSLWLGGIIGLTFGVVRGAGLWRGAAARSVNGLRRLMASMERLRRPVDRVALWVQALVGLASAALAVTPT